MSHEEAQRLHSQVDAELQEALKNPLIVEALEKDYSKIRAEAASQVERANALASTFQNHYAQATTNLVNEANAIVSALFPELEGMNTQQVAGALRLMAQSQPERVRQLQQLASRAQGIMEAQQRQQWEQQQGLALQQNHDLEKFTAAEEKRFEEATKYESPETMKAIRSQLYDVTEKAYGINKQTMQALYSGQQRVDSAAFVRSSAFQLMLKDAVSYRLAQRAVTEARHAAVPNVQRPGVSAPRSDNSEYASLERQFRGKDLTAKQGADLLLAHRARR
jgi:hypothetical protein